MTFRARKRMEIGVLLFTLFGKNSKSCSFVPSTGRELFWTAAGWATRASRGFDRRKLVPTLALERGEMARHCPCLRTDLANRKNRSLGTGDRRNFGLQWIAHSKIFTL